MPKNQKSVNYALIYQTNSPIINWSIMNVMERLCLVSSFIMMLTALPGCRAESDQTNKTSADPMIVHIIVGSTRTTHTGLKIAENIKAMADKRPEVKVEIVDIASYRLPFYTDEIAPASRKEEIPDSALRTWSDKIEHADGYIIVAPEYNSGYPAPLKNALDSLYVEWNNKPVAFVGYSGGPSGGAAMIAQLRDVVRGLQMIPIAADIKIPQSWQAFNENGELVNFSGIEKELNKVIDQLLKARNTSQK